MASTFNVPEGSTNHGDPNLLCVPPSWSDLAVFFGTNYLAHAATLVTRPGQSFVETIVDTANALFIPGSGMIHAIRVLFYDTDIHRTSPPLKKAARAGALCMVVKRTHVYQAIRRRDDDDGPGPDWFSDNFSLIADPVYVPLSRSFLGTCKIHNQDKYCLVEVPPTVPLREFMPEDEVKPEGEASPEDAPSSLSASGTFTYDSGSKPESAASSTRWSKSHMIEIPGRLDFAKILVSILQLVWGISTLYNARGNQIDLYGYAAFGLTVAPYAVMSFLNLLASLALPIHNTMYLVWNKDMHKATSLRTENSKRRRRVELAGMIATVDLDQVKKERDEHDGRRISYDQGGPFEHPVRLAIYSFFYLLVAVLPLAIVGAFTSFRTGTDVRVQRAWILAWLIIGSASPILISELSVMFGVHTRVTSLQKYILRRQGRGRRSHNIATHPGKLGNAWFALIILFPLWIPAIGGMVVVGKMLQDFGVCTRLI
ncbi:hypothetical protein F5883DRAFT_615254 [Diaporthe sp. PMI_573]|jgi:hypothetical protein|nr:hypothetical protein F5883DRAFT_615254 [Diaporthaceae sp. PMI_573]